VLSAVLLCTTGISFTLTSFSSLYHPPLAIFSSSVSREREFLLIFIFFFVVKGDGLGYAQLVQDGFGFSVDEQFVALRGENQLIGKYLLNSFPTLFPFPSLFPLPSLFPFPSPFPSPSPFHFSLLLLVVFI
jgi:hypothetical protein